MKSNDLRHTCCNVYSKKSFSFVFCEIRYCGFVSMLKEKTISKKLDPDVSVVSINNESEDITKKRVLGWVKGVLCKLT